MFAGVVTMSRCHGLKGRLTENEDDDEEEDDLDN